MSDQRCLLISPYAKKLRDGNTNPKNFPFWSEVISSFREKGWVVTQIGVTGEDPLGATYFHQNVPLSTLRDILKSHTVWASVDNFFHHFAWYHGVPGVVLFGKSDPLIFGHDVNLNYIKDRKNLRSRQFLFWEGEPFDPTVFPEPEEVTLLIESFHRVKT